jgi:hypothetical protein
MDDGMMIDDAQGCNEAREKLYAGPSLENWGHPGAIEGHSVRRQANTRLLCPQHKALPSPSLRLPIQQWPPLSRHTLLLSLSQLPFPLPLAQSNVACPLQPQLQSARSLPSSFAMTPAYPLPPTSVVARSVVLRAQHLRRKRPARSGPWKRPKCSSRAAIA